MNFGAKVKKLLIVGLHFNMRLFISMHAAYVYTYVCLELNVCILTFNRTLYFLRIKDMLNIVFLLFNRIEKEANNLFERIPKNFVL